MMETLKQIIDNLAYPTDVTMDEYRKKRFIRLVFASFISFSLI